MGGGGATSEIRRIKEGGRGGRGRKRLWKEEKDYGE